MNPSYMLHMNNGIPDPEEQMAIRRNWETMVGAKKAGKVIFTFNESADRMPRLDVVDMTQADKQWQELSVQSRENILTAHRVTSPLLFGIRDSGGLGSNADEMKSAYRIFNKNIIEPYQQIVTDSLEEIFKGMGIVADIYIESNDLFADAEDTAPQIAPTAVADNATTDINVAAPVAPAGASVSDVTYNGAQIASALEIVAAVGTGGLTVEQAIVFMVQFLQLPIDVATAMFQPSQGSAVAKLSAQKKKINLSDPQEKPPIFTDEDEAWWCEFLEDKGEIVDEEEWELIEAEPVNLASVRSYSDPDKPSEMDSGLYKIRYSYSKNLSKDSRRFCRQMVSAAKAGFVYRYEDLTGMSADTNELNPNMGHNGSTFSVWLFKGGVNCKHFFERRVYFRKREKGRFIADNGLESSDPISVSKAIRAGMPLRDIAKGFATANTRTYDLPNNGRYPGTN
jgi:hypothetical protein